MSETGARNTFIIATLTLASIDSPGSNITVNISSRPAESTVTGLYKPIIVSLNGLSYGMGAYVPLTSNGSMTLDDSPHSFGFERRLSDLLERYTILDQLVEVSVVRAKALDEDILFDPAVDSPLSVWRGQVVDWRRDASSQRLTLNLKGFELPRTVFPRTVNAIDFPNAQQNALGRALPIVFGEEIEVKPVCISADGNTDPEFAYMTTLKDQFVSGGIQKYYAKNLEGRYVQVKTPSDPGQAVFNYPSGGSSSALLNTYEYLFPFTTPSDGGWIITSFDPIDLDFHDYIVRIYQRSGTNTSIGQLIEIGRGSDDQQFPFSLPRVYDIPFSRPVILEPSREYLVGIYSRKGDVKSYNAAAGTTPGYRRVVSASDSLDWLEPVNLNRWAQTLYAVKLTDTTSTGTDSNGFGYAKFKMDQKAISNTLFDKIPLDDVDTVVATNGLKDVNGFVATAGAVITRPDHAIRTMLSFFAGNTWDNERVSGAAYSDTYTGFSTATDRYFRKVGGRSEGRQTAAQIIEDICKSCAVRVGQIAVSGTQPLTVYGWSTTRPTRAVFTNRNCSVLFFEQRESSTVINRATAYAGESLRGITLQDNAADGVLKNYVSIGETYNGLDSTATVLTSASTNIYGVRPNGATLYKFLGSNARFATDYLCALFGKPHSYVTLETDWDASTGVGEGLTFLQIPVLAVVEITHPELPTYFGSSADPGPATYAGSATDPATGQYIVRARTYRGQVEGIEYLFGSNESLKIRFTVRLLTNYPNDPT